MSGAERSAHTGDGLIPATSDISKDPRVGTERKMGLERKKKETALNGGRVPSALSKQDRSHDWDRVRARLKATPNSCTRSGNETAAQPAYTRNACYTLPRISFRVNNVASLDSPDDQTNARIPVFWSRNPTNQSRDLFDTEYPRLVPRAQLLCSGRVHAEKRTQRSKVNSPNRLRTTRNIPQLSRTEPCSTRGSYKNRTLF